MIYAISCPLWPSVYECQRVKCAFTSPVRTECGMLVMCCMQCCMSVLTVFSTWMCCLEDVYIYIYIYMFEIVICLLLLIIRTLTI